MKSTILLLSLFLLGISPSIAQDKSCQLGNSKTTVIKDTDYQLRQKDGNRRCEGIIRRQIGRGLELVSLAVGRLSNNNPLSLKVPSTSNNQPQIFVRHPERNYQLDEVTFNFVNGWFKMQWDNSILKQAKVQPSTLFAIAEGRPAGSNSRPIKIPVILDSTKKQYEIVFRCGECEVKIRSFEVSSGSQKMKCTENLGDNRDPRFLCTGENSPRGRYTMRLSYKVKPTEASEYESIPPIIADFRHDPEWLK